MLNSTKDSREKVSLEKVSLEELLRFKKAERPNQAFWDKFDMELHQSMMQSLVKKDPWPVQLMRGLSGKFVQSAAIAVAAVVLVLFTIRPALVTSVEQGHPVVASVTKEEAVDAVVVAAAQAPVAGLPDDVSVLVAEADYEIAMLTAASIDISESVTPDYGLDHLDVASYDSSAYSSGMALTGVTSTGLASLVY